MKLIHLTDIHMTPRGEDLHDLPPLSRLQSAIDSINRHHGDAELCVITGDLTDRGERDAYETLSETLDRLAVPCRLLIGNHDDRCNFRQVFTGTPTDENGYIQWAESTRVGRFLYLDTMQPGTHAGHYGPDRQAWLRAQLDDAGDQPVYLFMHHQPAPVHLGPIDAIGLVHGPAFHQIVTEHRDHIRHIFFGHCHLTLAGSVCGVPVSGMRSILHQSWPDFSDSRPLCFAPLSPAYGVVFATELGVTVHSFDFAYGGPIEQAGPTPAASLRTATSAA